MGVINNIKVGSTNYDISIPYGTCTTAANTAAKVCSDIAIAGLVGGLAIRVKFTNANTAQNPTLNVNGKGAKAIYAEGAAATYSWAAGDVVTFIYDGTNWVMQNSRVITSGSSTPSSGVTGQIHFII